MTSEVLPPIIAPPPGSIVLFSGRGLVPGLIEFGTCSPFSHGAHVCRITRDDLLAYRPVRTWRMTAEQIANWQDGIYLIESTTLGGLPCSILGRQFSGVQVHPYAEYMRSYEGRVWVMPLLNPLYRAESQRLTDKSLDLVGTPYDLAGAGLAWTRFLKRLCFLRVSDRRTMFCIETILACEMFAMQGRRLPEIDPGEATPVELVRTMVRCGLFRRPTFAGGQSA